MRRSHGTADAGAGMPRLDARVRETRAEALTECAIVVAVVVLGIAAILVLMRGATSGDIAVLMGTKIP
jgi:hypothetical protein